MLRPHFQKVFRLAYPVTPILRATSVGVIPASFRSSSSTPSLLNGYRSGRQVITLSGNFVVSRNFHASRRNESLPLLLAALKSSYIVSALQGITRVSLTLLVPLAMGRRMGRRWLRKMDKYPDKFPDLEAARPRILWKLRINNIFFKVVLYFPVGLIILVMLASMERTPLTGRMRLIVLSPDEEESIARDLAGAGWYKAVDEILSTTHGPPKYVPTTDWRYMWVERILRRLESVVPALQDENLMREAWLKQYPDSRPYPPPPEYPLIPRPRASQRLHNLEPPIADSGHRHEHVAGDFSPHSVLGPPYSLLVAEQPDQSNAFSYGFGQNGGGGVVVFSGFLDEILRNTAPTKSSGTRPKSNSPLSFLVRSVFPSSPSFPPIPTPEQDAQLAILVAHELAHLLLSHHLETLSSASVFLPSLTSIVTDLFRALLFPITMVGGPFINDALKQVGEVGRREWVTAADSCSSHTMEIEADVVSLRLLALAGWDARAAVNFWESRVSATQSQELRQQAIPTQLRGVLPGALWVSQDGGVHSTSHPVDNIRVKKLVEELERWEAEKTKAVQAKVMKAGDGMIRLPWFD